MSSGVLRGEISTHALLAEGDHAAEIGGYDCLISTHALLAEGDARLLCAARGLLPISTHALLAEGDAD